MPTFIPRWTDHYRYFLHTVARLVARLSAHPATGPWPAGSRLASMLFAALAVAGPVDARHIVDWAWRHSDSPADHTSVRRGSYEAGTSAKSSYLRRDAVRELVASVIFFLRYEEIRRGPQDQSQVTRLRNQVTSLHDAVLDTFQVNKWSTHWWP